jgi:lipid-A-disaccharide synthase
MSRPRIALVAGEASGDRLGASLIRAAAKIRPDLEFFGVAGPAMIDAGCQAVYDSRELAVMGIFEVVSHLPRLRRLKLGLENHLLADPPAVFVGIDAPDFNLRVERKLRKAGIPTVQYVSPSVWAWREGRVKVLRKACDRVLCLLPFEEEFLERRGVSATFVGHPLADELSGDRDRFTVRKELGIEAETLVALLPGSRAGEVSRLGPVFARTARWLSAQIPGIRFACPVATPELGGILQDCFSRLAAGVPVQVFDGQSHDVIAASDVVLLASGTATLETMLLNRPMVVAYRMAQLTHDLLWLTSLPDREFFSLPNLLSGRSIVPEFLQHEATPQALGRALQDILESPERQRDMSLQFDTLHRQLQRCAAEQAAQAVLEVAGLA